MSCFDNLPFDKLKTLFNSAISSLLQTDSGTIPCTLIYGVTRYDDCINCTYDPIGNKSSNIFQDGGPMPFGFSQTCPMCNGAGKKPIISTEDINIIVVFDPKQFVNIETPVNNPDGYIQTFGKKEMTTKFRRAKEIEVATDINGYFTRRYERVGEPTPLGFGNNEFVICTWRRTG